MKPYLIKTSAGATLMAIALCLTPQAQAADASARREVERTAMAQKTAGASARDIIGQNVRNTAGEDLGEVKDLVVSPKGKIVYALVGSGGVLGVGEKLRAVPFSALKPPVTAEGHRRLMLETTKAKFESAPILRSEEVDLLTTEDRARGVFEYFGQDWNREKMDLRTAAADKSGRLFRASKLMGKDLKNAGQEVGEIEDLVIDHSSRQASLLLDPENDYTGSSQRFILGFDQVMQSMDDKDAFATNLTRADFERAKPARDDWYSATTGYPYVWDRYSYTRGVGYSARSAPITEGDTAPVAVRDAVRDDAARGDAVREERRDDRKMTVAEVRDLLSKDPVLADSARYVTLREDGRKLVIRGTVPSRDIKERISDRVEELARGWRVDDEMEVKSTAE